MDISPIVEAIELVTTAHVNFTKCSAMVKRNTIFLFSELVQCMV
jgi:hypothetical protein